MACHTLGQALAILAGHHLWHQVSVLAVVLVIMACHLLSTIFPHFPMAPIPTTHLPSNTHSKIWKMRLSLRRKSPMSRSHWMLLWSTWRYLTHSNMPSNLSKKVIFKNFRSSARLFRLSAPWRSRPQSTRYWAVGELCRSIWERKQLFVIWNLHLIQPHLPNYWCFSHLMWTACYFTALNFEISFYHPGGTPFRKRNRDRIMSAQEKKRFTSFHLKHFVHMPG